MKIGKLENIVRRDGWCVPVTSVLKRLRLEDCCAFDALMGHKVRQHFKILTSLWPLHAVTSVLMLTLWLGCSCPASFIPSCYRSSWKAGLTSCLSCCLLPVGWVLSPCHSWRRGRREVGLSSQHPGTTTSLPALPDPVSCSHDWPSLGS